ncbi:GspH/FimT family pseudopilin [Dethiobacter alkaliphilus]|uniref:GspH/FimT family pseudopilin n=1 Tax=Dethiobacter alkaliphilus TaxID=427926 RepID=UPI002225CCF6|nr:GspH/FimT family pseudopilin [Dethiobacter alkaliphilus]MCW3490288.1 GspH/FimT family pseudopilin [Dethiobacter alkaliphilus]
MTELVTVLVILGILCMVAVPVVGHISTWGLRTAAQELAAQVRQARQTAIAGGEVCYVVFYEFSGRYRVDLPGESEWVSLPEGVTYGGNNFVHLHGRPTVYFRYTGAPNRGGHVVLRDKRGNRRYVIVTPVTGRVRISETPP